MNPTVILTIVSLVLETTLTAIKLMRKQKPKTEVEESRATEGTNGIEASD